MREFLRKRSWVLFLLSAALLIAPGAYAGTVSAGGAQPAEKAFEGLRSIEDDPISAQADASYTQQFYNYETGAASRLWGPEIDYRGDYYYLKKNADWTVSYIFQNYGPNNKTTPYITINGNVSAFAVTADTNASYVYYRISGEDAVYRLPLTRGAANPERRTFTFGGTNFEFQSFALAQDPDQFLLYSKVDSNLKVNIGLFSFNGGTEPLRTWTGTLPQEWPNEWQPIYDGDFGYGIRFEASTAGTRIWLVVSKTLFRSDGGRNNSPWWFFFSNIAESGTLSPYDPSSEIPGWGGGNLKLLSIGRYGRVVQEYNGSDPDPTKTLSLREFDPASRQYKEGAVTTWTDGNGVSRPIGDFFAPSGSGGSFWRDYTLDGQGNFYLTFNHIFSDGKGDWQRFALFSPSQASTIGTPNPDPSANNGAVFAPGSVTLKSTLPTMPAGTTITGSVWEVFAAASGNAVPVYRREQTGTNAAHTVQTALPEGSYTWRVAYDWVRRGSETVTGSTKWSPNGSIVVKNPASTAFTVTFNSQGGSYVAPITNVQPGTFIAQPANPTRSGYVFTGWYTDSVLSRTWNFTSDVITGDTTLYAGWQATGSTLPATPQPLYPINGRTVTAGNITFQATAFSAADGSRQTGSEWYFHSLTSGVDNKEVTLNSPGNTCVIEAETSSRMDFEWRVRYVYRTPGGATQRTSWSEWADFTVEADDILSGCNAGFGVLPLPVLAAFAFMVLRRKK